MRNSLSLVLILLIAVLAAGCASSQRGDVYSRGEAGNAQRVAYGTIKALRPVRIEGTKSVVGGGAGAIAGGLAGSAIGGGTASSVMAVVGAIAGGLAGAAAEEGLTRVQGVEFTIDLDNSGTIAVVQEVDPKQVYRVGDRVELTYAPNAVRVAPASTPAPSASQ